MQPVATYQNAQTVSVFQTQEYFEVAVEDCHGITQSIKLPRNVLLSKKISNAPPETKQEPKVIPTEPKPKQSIVRIDKTEDGRQIEIRNEPKVTRLPRAEPPSRTKPLSRKFEAKLTKSQVMEIKALLNDPKFMSTYPSCYKAYKDLGEAYKVTYMCIQLIHKGVTWKHVWLAGHPQGVSPSCSPVNLSTQHHANSCRL